MPYRRNEIIDFLAKKRKEKFGDVSASDSKDFTGPSDPMEAPDKFVGPFTFGTHETDNVEKMASHLTENTEDTSVSFCFRKNFI